jgi:hypothetical protein
MDPNQTVVATFPESTRDAQKFMAFLEKKSPIV